MAKTITTESFTEASEEERCLWDVNPVIYKNRYKKAKSRKKLAEQFWRLSSCTNISCKPILILLPIQDFTHTDLFLFFLFLLTSSKATIAAAVSSSLSIFK